MCSCTSLNRNHGESSINLTAGLDNLIEANNVFVSKFAKRLKNQAVTAKTRQPEQFSTTKGRMPINIATKKQLNLRKI